MSDVLDPAQVLASVGRRIRDLRERRRLSQEDLAHEAGLHRTYVGGVERGERNVSVVNLYRIASALGVAASELLP
jgi:transcriptional regulator with XRE-family HTH domain